MEEKFIDIGVQLNVLESLSRILLEAIRDGENLKDYWKVCPESCLRQYVTEKILKIMI